MGLNPEQERSAYAENSVAVTAGAGTGKTHMLAERYLFHVRNQRMSPLSVVAVTFTIKAADELRARIRRRLVEAALDPKTIAEVDAAQISTIHGLAARICRDFYDLAGVPPDFTILDETAGPMWLGGRQQDALLAIDAELFAQVEFEWLESAVRQLLQEPHTAREALGADPNKVLGMIEAANEAAIEALTECEEWQAALAAADELRELVPSADDALLISRDAALRMLAVDAAGIRASVKTFTRSRPDHGSKNNWHGKIDWVRGILKPLKAKCKEFEELYVGEPGPADDEMFRRIDILRQAFDQAEAFIRGEKLKENLLDFSDLEYFAVQALKHPSGDARRHYAERWKAILVDEFQDTSPIQEELVGLLSGDAKLTVVGDDKQAIYGFRGADIEVFDRVRKKIVEERRGEEVELRTTYRTHGPLVELTNDVFDVVLGDKAGPLEAFRDEERVTGEPYMRAAAVEKVSKGGYVRPENIEARDIADRIEEMIGGGTRIVTKQGDERRLELGDIAVLTRKWDSIEKIGETLASRGISAVSLGGANLLKTQEALDVISLLQFLAEPADDIPLVALLRGPFFGVSDNALYEAGQKVNTWDGPHWWEVIKDDANFASPVKTLSELLEKRRELTAAELVRLADEKTGYSAIIANMPHGERREADLRGMTDLLSRLEKQGRAGIFDAAYYMTQLLRADVVEPRPWLTAGNAVSLLTIHGAKGLEWPVVFVAALTEGVQGGFERLTVDRELGLAFTVDEELGDKGKSAVYKLIKNRAEAREEDEVRRLLYVAVTRARDRVYISSSEVTGGNAWKMIQPGLESAGVECTELPYDAAKARPPMPGAGPTFPNADHIDIYSIARAAQAVPASGLTEYSACPRRFEYRYIKGHPGISEGPGGAALVGTLAHKALERNFSSAEELSREFPLASPEQVANALALAGSFKTSAVFAEFRNAASQPEVPFAFEVEGNTDQRRCGPRRAGPRPGLQNGFRDR
jgi:ATP-dependent helicase/nuclease subunit A